MKSRVIHRLAAFVVMAVLVCTFLSGCVTLGDRNPMATLIFSNGTEITFRLYPDKAPNTVKNFIQLANSGFYDGSPVHRIEEYFIIQTGMPADGSGSLNAGYYIEGEFSKNGFSKNDISHITGTVSMARSAGDGKEFYNSASSQFFITLNYQTSLDGEYAAFGRVVTGQKNIEAISRMDVDANKAPRDEIYVVSVRVETYGKDYGSPKTIKNP